MIADIPNIPVVTEIQLETHAFLNEDVNMGYYGRERNDERTSIQFLIQANRFKTLLEGNAQDFVKANYLVQAIRNFEAYNLYNK